MIARLTAAAILVALVCAILSPFVHMAAARGTDRLDVNGEPLSYNARCSTDTDCMERFE